MEKDGRQLKNRTPTQREGQENSSAQKGEREASWSLFYIEEGQEGTWRSLLSGLSSILFPASEDVLVTFIVYLAKTIKHSSIKNYLSAVRHLHIRNGFELNFKTFFRLQLVLKGIKRSQGDRTKIRLPITVHHLQLFYYLLAIPTTANHDSLMLWAAMTLAFFGFLRLGELTCNVKYSKDVHLSSENVTFFPNQSAPQHIFVFIKTSKTDPFRTGQSITIGKTDLPVCPVVAMKKYLSVGNNSPVM